MPGRFRRFGLGMVGVLVWPALASAQCDRLTEIGAPTADSNAFSGSAVVGADLDRNGMEDILIGAPGVLVQGVAAGAVEVTFAPALARTKLIEHPLPVAGDEFGAAIAVGDFDGDTHVDIAIGAPGRDDAGAGFTDSGSVFVFYGPAHTTWIELKSMADGAAFGTSLAVGSVMAGTEVNLVIGAPNETTGGMASAGAVYACSDNGGSWTLDAALTLAAPAGGEQHGRDVIVADFNDDQQDDVVASAPLADAGAVTDAGAVYFYAGPVATGTNGVQTVSPTPNKGGEFGASIAAGLLVGGDTQADLVVGAPLEDNGFRDEGYVYIGDGVDFSSPVTLTSASVEGVAWFGVAVAVGDFNGDGDMDVIGGEPRATPNGTMSGEATIWWGPSFSSHEAVVDPLQSQNQRFGNEIGVVDFTDDGIDEPLIGSPTKNVNATDDGATLHWDISGRQPLVRYSHGQSGSTGVPDLFGTGTGQAGSAGTVVISNGPASEMGALLIGMDPDYYLLARGGQAVLGVFTHALPFVLDAAGVAQFSFNYPQTFQCRFFYLEAFMYDGPTHICHTNGLQMILRN